MKINRSIDPAKPETHVEEFIQKDTPLTGFQGKQKKSLNKEK